MRLKSTTNVSSRSISLPLALSAVLSLGFDLSHAASLSGLGHLPNYDYSAAYDVSSDGSVVTGSVYTYFFITEQAFRWTRSGGMAGLGHLSNVAMNSRGDSISGDGSVVVGSSNREVSREGAFIWTGPNGMTPLVEPLPPETEHISAHGISADGTIVVGLIDTPTRREAFRWSAATGLIRLGDKSTGATDISADGKVIVGDGRNNSTDEAFRWTESNGVVSLGIVPGSPIPGRSAAAATSGDGTVIVGFNASAPGDEAFRWTETEGMVGLGYLGAGGFASYAWGISGDGQTIGGSSANDEGENAFIWTSTHGMRSLWDVVVSLGINPADSGWSSFTIATAFSFDGRFVVGVGQRNGTDEAFIADLTPHIALSLVPTGFRLTWPAGFQLQRTTAIGSAPWQNVTAAQPLTVSFGAGNEFYRLIEAP